jgi:DNA helicase-2/ATP-dependent DNA helicase PcrA
LRLLHNPRDDVALERVINEPARGIGKTTLKRLGEYAAARALGLLEAARAARHIGSLGAKTVGQVLKFVALIDHLAAVAAAPVEEVLGYVLSETGYKSQFEQSDREEDQQRLANIEELLTVAREFDEQSGGAGRLEEFLEQTSLAGDTDAWDEQSDRVTLMTLHASKGLEFPVVYLVAVEEGLLPHERSRDHPDQQEEERRLMFVGITRAREELQISRAEYRDFRGRRRITIPSQFLMELPRGEMDAQEVSSLEEAPLPGRTPPAGEEPSYDQSIAAAAAAATSKRSYTPQLVTAAQLGRPGESVPASPDEFYQGMLVLHPEKGLGHVVALSGSGRSRRAVVDFKSPPCRLSLILAKSALRPVRSQSTQCR